MEGAEKATTGRHDRPFHLETHDLAACNNKAAADLACGSFQLAIVLFQQALDGCWALLGADHPDTLTVAGNLGVALVKAGRHGDGLELIGANVADRVRVLGDEDPRTLAARDALAVAHRLAGHPGDAVAVAQQVTEQRSRVLGPAHLDTLTSRMGLALANAAMGDVVTAAEEITAALGDAERIHGTDHERTVALLQCAVTLAR
jgi:hypothetical protein